MVVAGLLPVGNVEMPIAQLQVEWFYMTFQCRVHAIQAQVTRHDTTDSCGVLPVNPRDS
jgi:hypothetical protein